MTERCDVVIVGAGVVGLGIGAALAKAGREVLVLERQEAIGTETSSRNSEVIHAGIYYPTDSLKARFCVRGKQLLYQHCADFNVPHERIGKLIVATREDQFSALRTYQEQAHLNGVGDLRWVETDELAELEPEVRGCKAVFSPTTGIIDSHRFMLSLEGILEAHGGTIAFHTNVEELRANSDISIAASGLELRPNWLINSAGLDAPELARQLGRPTHGYFAKGHYYALTGKSPFNHLVYPIAEEGGLGVHVTLDLAHQARFGPDVVWLENKDYEFDTAHYDAFVTAIRRYYPGLDEAHLHPSYTGIRPKLVRQGEPAADFVVNTPVETGIPGYIELLGIESPGLTATLAIAEHIVTVVCD